MNEECVSTTAPDISQSSDASLPSYTDDKKKPEPMTAIQNTTLQVRRDKNHSVSCRPQDLLQLGKTEGLIMLDDLDFRKFLLMVTKELEYNDGDNMIVYERIGVDPMPIADERSEGQHSQRCRWQGLYGSSLRSKETQKELIVSMWMFTPIHILT